jgi:PAX-interacting protein 1
VQPELVRAEIERKWHNIGNLCNIRHRVTGIPLPPFLDVEPTDNSNDMYHIECLQNMKAHIESPCQKKKDISQCKRCQGYFHTTRYCAYRPRCVECGKLHCTEIYSLPNTQPAKCLHCVESHPANYRGCKVYQEIIRTRFTSPWPTATNAAPQKSERRSEMTYSQKDQK